MSLTRNLTQPLTRPIPHAITQAGAGGWTPALWFLASEQGVWYDPSDMSTMFQDSAGTTPVTAVEQPVGLVLDKRLGLVRGSELVINGDLSNGTTGWTVAGSGTTLAAVSGELEVTATGGSYPGGRPPAVTTVVGAWYEATCVGRRGTTASSVYIATGSYVSAANATTTNNNLRMIFQATSTSTSISCLIASAAGTGTAYFDNISVRELPGNHASQPTTAQKPVLSARRNKLLATTTMATQSVTLTASAHTLSFKGTGTVTLSGASTAGPLVGTGADNRVSLTFTPTAGSVTFTVSGSVTEAQLEDGSAVGTYQRVTTASDYDTVGFPHYLKFDGVDDNLVTAAIDFTATDKMTVVAGVRKLSDAAAGALVELSAITGGQQNFSINAPRSAVPNFGTTLRSSDASSAEIINSSSYPAPISVIYCALFNYAVADNKVITRINGTQQGADSITGAVGGNFGNYPLYIGRRGGTSLPFTGHLYSLTVRGASTDAAGITAGETYTAGKTGITL